MSGGAPAWTLTPLTEAERPLLMRLAELYLYDFSEILGWEIGDDGRFVQNSFFDRYGAEPGHHALLLRSGRHPAGFALVDEHGSLPGGDARHVIAEFFVVRAHRRKGLGAAVAREIFDRFPGGWRVLQRADNAAAQAFWRRVIAGYTGGRYTERRTADGDVVQEFDTADKVVG